jgi:hypothetical protein
MKNEIKKMLAESAVPVQISFTKKDGTLRNMVGTTNLKLIPESDHPKNNKCEKTESETSQRVYDLENNGWRSFIISNVIDFKPTV